MKSREGTVVDADDLISEVISLAREEVNSRYKDLGEEEIEDRSKKIGLGALKFFMLKTDPSKDMIYNPKESVSFEGETGPYVQYAYARINSIFEKGEINKIRSKVEYSLYDSAEKQLIKKLGDYPKIVADSMKNLKPSHIARYLIELSQMFNEYYHSHQILKEADDIKNARILLLDGVKTVLKNGLNLLGIDAVERM
jgi:arginyl-tRNA synthetase